MLLCLNFPTSDPLLSVTLEISFSFNIAEWILLLAKIFDCMSSQIIGIQVSLLCIYYFYRADPSYPPFHNLMHIFRGICGAA